VPQKKKDIFSAAAFPPCILQVLARLGVQRLVVGHTPQASGRAGVRCQGRLLLLDTGMSSGMLGSPAAAWICHAGEVQGSNSGPLGNEMDGGGGSARSGQHVVSVVAYADGVAAAV
jgi:hypothetical protein